MNVGVLGLQGAVREHLRAVERLGLSGRVVKRAPDLASLDALILPGGESTTMNLLAQGELLAELRRLALGGFPMFGTCAGMILLARDVEGQAEPVIGAMDISVARNASGRQVDSFETVLDVDGVGKDVPAVFIRAPYITRVGTGVRILARHQGVPVLARQGKILAASFHPELTEDLRIHKYFTAMV